MSVFRLPILMLCGIKANQFFAKKLLRVNLTKRLWLTASDQSPSRWAMLNFHPAG
jgi:hypothetical protein